MRSLLLLAFFAVVTIATEEYTVKAKAANNRLRRLQPRDVSNLEFNEIKTFPAHHAIHSVKPITIRKEGDRIILPKNVKVVKAHHMDPPTAPISVDRETQRLINAQGCEVVYHGINTVEKISPFHPVLTEDKLDVLEELGFNTIRLGLMWDGTQPAAPSGQPTYNETYLEILRDTIARARNHNIFTLVDVHQDVFARKYCGDGAPSWASDSGNTTGEYGFPWPLAKPYQLGPDEVPTGDQCNGISWFTYYFSKACNNAFQTLYSNRKNIADHFIGFWVHAAEKFRDLADAVLGFELMNEPWGGDIYENISWLLPGYGDKENLQPLWEKTSAAIRKVDPDHAIFFEGITYDWFDSGFTRAPGGEEWSNKTILSYHFYVPPDFSADVQFEARVRDMQRLKVGGFLSEFSVNEEPELISTWDVLKKADDLFQSWQWWGTFPYDNAKIAGGSIKAVGQLSSLKSEAAALESRDKALLNEAIARGDMDPKAAMLWERTRAWRMTKTQQKLSERRAKEAAAKGDIETEMRYSQDLFLSDGTLNPKIEPLVRTYPQIIAGRGISTYFNNQTGEFRLVYSIDKERVRQIGRTVIFTYSDILYPFGKNVVMIQTRGDESTYAPVQPIASTDEKFQFIYIDHDIIRSRTGDNITVIIIPVKP